MARARRVTAGDLRRQLAEADGQAKEIDGRLEELLQGPPAGGDASDDASRVSAFAVLTEASRFDQLSRGSRELEGQIKDSRALSERVSRTVRTLDEAQMNVQQALALVEDVVNLKGCANGVVAALRENDLVGATGYVRQFHDIASVAAQASDDYERMVAAEKTLRSRVLNEFYRATKTSVSSGAEAEVEGGPVSEDEVAKYCALLGPLRLAEEGLQGFLAFARREMQNVVAAGAQAHPSKAAEELSRLFNGAAAFLNRHLAIAAAALSLADGGAALLQLVHHDIENAAVQILQTLVPARRFADRARALEQIAAAGEQLTNKQVIDLNEEVDTVALVIQHAETYDRFLRHLALELEQQTQRQAIFPAVTPLNESVAEVGSYFSLFEQRLVEFSIRKAISLDELTPVVAGGAANEGEGGITSSCVEDSFFVAQSSAQRAVASGHVGSCSAVVNHVNNALNGDLFEHLKARAHAAAAHLGKLCTTTGGLADNAQHMMRSVGAVGRDMMDQAHSTQVGMRGAVGLIEQRAREGSQEATRASLASLNNAHVAASSCLRLKEELQLEVREAFPEGAQTQQLTACVAELQTTSLRFSALVDEQLTSLASQLRPKLRTVVAELLDPKTKGVTGLFLVTETDFSSQGVALWTQNLLLALQSLLATFMPSSNGLSEANARALLIAVAAHLAKRLELVLCQHRFNQLGSLQLDRDVRAVVAWFTARTGREVRDSFVRLNQVAVLLNLDSPNDLLDTWGGKIKGAAWQLSADEAKKVLRLREDFNPRAVDRLQLQ